MPANNVTEHTGRSIGTIVKPDRDQKKFEGLVKQWVEGKISYDTLQKNLPSYDANIIKKLLLALLKRACT